ncbi:MAG: hypothetical protein ISR72_04320 [Methylobacter sp.]|nr:hypothetical protein [Methylobacter sp.]
MKLSCEFATPWPAVLVEMRDFIDMARLFHVGRYKALAVRVVISKSVPAECLNQSAFQAFRTAIIATPGIKAEFAAAEHPAHRVDIEIQR